VPNPLPIKVKVDCLTMSSAKWNSRGRPALTIALLLLYPVAALVLMRLSQGQSEGVPPGSKPRLVVAWTRADATLDGAVQIALENPATWGITLDELAVQLNFNNEMPWSCNYDLRSYSGVARQVGSNRTWRLTVPVPYRELPVGSELLISLQTQRGHDETRQLLQASLTSDRQRTDSEDSLAPR
jgi:hypothetical protein